MSKVVCGINGFGRFGLHLLSYYLNSLEKSEFELKYINDDMLSIDHALGIIKNDPYVEIHKNFSVSSDGEFLVFNDSIKIKYTNDHSDNIEWLGSPDIFLECSGKYTDANNARSLKKGRTKKVLISATSMNADQMLVYGFNHLDYSPDSDVISYGSCTVNAYVQLTSRLDKLFGVSSSDVNVIHNVPEYQLHNGFIETPGLAKVAMKRKGCTLSQVAPKLLECVTDENFNVNYTLIPYTGVSIIDYRYTLKSPLDEEVWSILESECEIGDLKGLYAVQNSDAGPAAHQNSSYSSIIIKENSFIRGSNLYLQAYFDNENSVNRFFDLTNFISLRISG
jgi:glyceraldehyde 3-phosphate dehydrogenase